MMTHIEVVREALLFAGQRIPQDAECKRGESCDVCPVLDAATQALDSLEAELACYREALERIAGNPGPIVYEGQLVKDYDTDWFRPIVDAALTKETP